MPRTPVIDDDERDMLDELVSYFEELEHPAPLPGASLHVWDACKAAGS